MGRRTQPTLRDHDDPIASLLEPTSMIHARVRGNEATVAVVDDRIIVANDEIVALDIDVAGLRRVQVDIERDRDGLLVIVPIHVRDEPQVVSFPPEEYEALAHTLMHIGRVLSAPSG